MTFRLSSRGELVMFRIFIFVMIDFVIAPLIPAGFP